MREANITTTSRAVSTNAVSARDQATQLLAPRNLRRWSLAAADTMSFEAEDDVRDEHSRKGLVCHGVPAKMAWITSGS